MVKDFRKKGLAALLSALLAGCASGKPVNVDYTLKYGIKIGNYETDKSRVEVDGPTTNGIFSIRTYDKPKQDYKNKGR